MTVETASSMEKLESIPRVKSVIPRMIAQKFGDGIVSIAAGYATKARPMDATLSDTGESRSTRYPTTEKQAKPAMKLIKAFVRAIFIPSPIIGLLVGLKLEYDVIVPMQIPREKKI